MTEERFVKDEEYKELRPANAYDVAANETWLEDMAKQGWRLVRMTGWSGVFQETEPLPAGIGCSLWRKKGEAPPPEVIEAYRELGWGVCRDHPGHLPRLAVRGPGCPGAGHGPGGPGEWAIGI